MTVQIITPVPTPSNGVDDVGSNIPNQIALPIKDKSANVAKNVTTPAITEDQEILYPASAVKLRLNHVVLVFLCHFSYFPLKFK